MATAIIRSTRNGDATTNIDGASRNDLIIGDNVTVQYVGTGASTYSWSIVYAPEGSTATFTGVSTNPSPGVFQVDKEGSYLIRLVVNAGIAGEDTQYLRLRALTEFGSLHLVAAGERRDATAVIPVDINPVGWADDQNRNLQTLLEFVKPLVSSGRVIYVDANDGTENYADYSTIQEAIDFAKIQSPAPSESNPYVILVRAGLYEEDIVFEPFINVVGWSGSQAEDEKIVLIRPHSVVGFHTHLTNVTDKVSLINLHFEGTIHSTFYALFRKEDIGTLGLHFCTLTSEVAAVGQSATLEHQEGDLILEHTKVVANDGGDDLNFAYRQVGQDTRLFAKDCVFHGPSCLDINLDRHEAQGVVANFLRCEITSTGGVNSFAVRTGGVCYFDHCLIATNTGKAYAVNPNPPTGNTIAGDIVQQIRWSFIDGDIEWNIDETLGANELRLGSVEYGSFIQTGTMAHPPYDVVRTALIKGDTLFYDNTITAIAAHNVQDAIDLVYGIASTAVQSASNVGTGLGVFKQKSGTDLEFKSLLAGTDISITAVGDDLEIAYTGLTSGVTQIGEDDTFVTVVDNGTTNGTVTFTIEGTDVWRVDGNGDLIPMVDDTYNIGQATLNVANIFNTGLTFNTNNSLTGAEGVLTWNGSDGTLDLGLKGGNVTLQIGQETVFRAKNTTTTNMSDGDVVYITGSDGTNVEIGFANAGNATADKTIGIVTEPINISNKGFVTTQGLVRGLNLDPAVYSDGDTVYLSTTDGGYTNIAPTFPNKKVEIGYVVNAHATQGELFVHVKDIHLENWEEDATGNFLPLLDSTYNIGSTGYTVSNIFTNEITTAKVDSDATTDLTLAAGGTDWWAIDSTSGHFIPQGTSGTQDIGDATHRVQSIYVDAVSSVHFVYDDGAGNTNNGGNPYDWSLNVDVTDPASPTLKFNGQTLGAQNLSDLNNDLVIDWTDINNTPTTIAGYGITDSPDSLLDLGIVDGTNGQVLTTDGAGAFTFQDASGGIAYTDLSVIENAASGIGTLSYDNAGVFTYTPPDRTEIVMNDTKVYIDDDNSGALTDGRIYFHNNGQETWHITKEGNLINAIDNANLGSNTTPLGSVHSYRHNVHFDSNNNPSQDGIYFEDSVTSNSYFVLKMNQTTKRLQFGSSTLAYTSELGTGGGGGDTIEDTTNTAPARMVAESSATAGDEYIALTGHIIPITTETYDLGSTNERFRDLYLQGNTIYLGNTQIGNDADGDFTIDTAKVAKELLATDPIVGASIARENLLDPFNIDFSTLDSTGTTVDFSGSTAVQVEGTFVSDLQVSIIDVPDKVYKKDDPNRTFTEVGSFGTPDYDRKGLEFTLTFNAWDTNLGTAPANVMISVVDIYNDHLAVVGDFSNVEMILSFDLDPNIVANGGTQTFNTIAKAPVIFDSFSGETGYPERFYFDNYVKIGKMSRKCMVFVGFNSTGLLYDNNAKFRIDVGIPTNGEVLEFKYPYNEQVYVYKIDYRNDGSPNDTTFTLTSSAATETTPLIETYDAVFDFTGMTATQIFDATLDLLNTATNTTNGLAELDNSVDIQPNGVLLIDDSSTTPRRFTVYVQTPPPFGPTSITIVSTPSGWLFSESEFSGDPPASQITGQGASLVVELAPDEPLERETLFEKNIRTPQIATNRISLRAELEESGSPHNVNNATIEFQTIGRSATRLGVSVIDFTPNVNGNYGWTGSDQDNLEIIRKTRNFGVLTAGINSNIGRYSTFEFVGFSTDGIGIGASRSLNEGELHVNFATDFQGLFGAVPKFGYVSSGAALVSAATSFHGNENVVEYVDGDVLLTPMVGNKVVHLGLGGSQQILDFNEQIYVEAHQNDFRIGTTPSVTATTSGNTGTYTFTKDTPNEELFSVRGDARRVTINPFVTRELNQEVSGSGAKFRNLERAAVFSNGGLLTVREPLGTTNDNNTRVLGTIASFDREFDAGSLTLTDNWYIQQNYNINLVETDANGVKSLNSATNILATNNSLVTFRAQPTNLNLTETISNSEYRGEYSYTVLDTTGDGVTFTQRKILTGNKKKHLMYSGLQLGVVADQVINGEYETTITDYGMMGSDADYNPIVLKRAGWVQVGLSRNDNTPNGYEILPARNGVYVNLGNTTNTISVHLNPALTAAGHKYHWDMGDNFTIYNENAQTLTVTFTDAGGDPSIPVVQPFLQATSGQLGNFVNSISIPTSRFAVFMLTRPRDPLLGDYELFQVVVK